MSWSLSYLFLLLLCRATATDKSSAAIFNYEKWIPITNEKGDKLQPPRPYSDSWKNPTTEVFIAIAHYRDDRCGKTLHNFISKAKYPQRLKFGKRLCVSVLFFLT